VKPVLLVSEVSQERPVPQVTQGLLVKGDPLARLVIQVKQGLLVK
jgi:hypothetical protein